MRRQVKVIPILYNRLSFALDVLPKKLQGKSDAEIEFVGYQLEVVRNYFTFHWDKAMVKPNQRDENTRYLVGRFDSIPAFFSVEGRMRNQSIEVRNIKIFLDSEMV